jgi:hypothetical protein
MMMVMVADHLVTVPYKATVPTMSPPSAAPAAIPSASEPSVFDLLNALRRQWFLSQDHLLSNALSIQRAKDGSFTWVEFTPQFHSSLIQDALRVLKDLDPSVPLGRVKKVLFVFVLEVMEGTRPAHAFNPCWKKTEKSGKDVTRDNQDLPSGAAKSMTVHPPVLPPALAEDDTDDSPRQTPSTSTMSLMASPTQAPRPLPKPAPPQVEAYTTRPPLKTYYSKKRPMSPESE